MKNNKILHCQNSSNRKTTKYQTVRTVPIKKQQNTTLSEQFQHPRKTTKYHSQDVPKSNRKKTKCHTVRIVPIEKQQNTTLSEQFQHP
jgi:hypothetical protein